MGTQLPAGRNARRRSAQTQLHIRRARQGGLRTSLRQTRQDALASRLRGFSLESSLIRTRVSRRMGTHGRRGWWNGLGIPLERLNVNGGAIVVGQPYGV